jgi:hypothetical protein
VGPTYRVRRLHVALNATDQQFRTRRWHTHVDRLWLSKFLIKAHAVLDNCSVNRRDLLQDAWRELRKHDAMGDARQSFLECLVENDIGYVGGVLPDPSN